jgi:ATP synthase protein I
VGRINASTTGQSGAQLVQSKHAVADNSNSRGERTQVQASDSWQDDADKALRKPLTREQAQALALTKPGVSVWAVVGLQAVVGTLVAALALGFFGRPAALSALYGCAVVMLPAALFAGALRTWLVKLQPAFALFGFAFGELLKISLTVIFLLLAPRLLPGLSWPAMLVGLVATLQVYWVALILRGKLRPKANQA